MVRFRDSTDTSTIFQFDTTEKIIDKGSLLPSYTVKNVLNKRANNVDIIHKKGIKNKKLKFTVVFKGSNMETNAIALDTIIQAQTTVYLDTEGFYDNMNTTYVFDGNVATEPIKVKQSDSTYVDDYIEMKFNLIEIDQ